MNYMSKKNTILTEYHKMNCKYNHLTETIERIIKELLATNNVQYYIVTSRVKELDSLEKKIDSKGEQYEKLDDITDIAGIRIITYYSDDVDKVAEIITNEFKIDLKNSIDKRKLLEPDRFGYLSIHFIAELSDTRLSLTEYSQFQNMRFEIQIRSILQHTWAEIEHDLGYKSAIEIPKEIRRNFFQVASLLEVADDKFNEIRIKLNEYSEDVKIKLEQTNNNQSILLDSISLKAFLKNNSDIKVLNEKIAQIACVDLLEIEQDYSNTLRKLEWLKILNIDELKEMLAKNKEIAVKLAEKVFENRPCYDGGFVYEDIGVFYLCYAELLRNTNNIEKITQYVEDNNLQDDENQATFAILLLRWYSSIIDTVN